jgi:hypothetical protein
MISSRIAASSLALISAFAGQALAQECVGLPAQSHGTFTAGLEGTDGAVGEGIKFARSENTWSLQLGYKGLAKHFVPNRMATFSVQASHGLWGKLKDVCVTGAPEVTQYSVLDRGVAAGFPSPDLTNGQYRRVGMPAGLSLGHSFAVRRWLTLVPFFNPQIIAEFEHFAPDSGALQTRSIVSYRSAVGVTAVSNWFVVRSWCPSHATWRCRCSSAFGTRQKTA